MFKTRKGVDSIMNGKLTLGADASVAAGPVGRHTGVATDLVMKAEVVSYCAAAACSPASLSRVPA